MLTRIERGIPRSLLMKPSRSRVCIIWFTEGTDTRKCRSMSDSAGALPNRPMYRVMNRRYSS